ncbi:DEAD-box ATP-dependent RNA helicase 31-like protein isoform X1 [Cinnamomum micranthum f. kanehirae]|uniref:ATP-dependent RNA helicase n=1 Tax=Cinnamomum micranthum f. kanehirae TaxID=337451 RepID=A0A3S3QZX9_9MAGN|nr:DEAD-box ATP-dependent RNA helicase 31-like protein isoform X1 [Cinnamomum micranthum f. kanehirae]
MTALLHPFSTTNSSSSMKLRVTTHPPHRALSILTGAFPFKLKYRVLSARPLKDYSCIICRSLSRGVAVHTSALSRGGGESRPGRVGQRKSLVEDGHEDKDEGGVRDMGRSRNGVSSESLKRRRVGNPRGLHRDSKDKEAGFFDGFSPQAKRGGREAIRVMEDVDDDSEDGVLSVEEEDLNEVVLKVAGSLRQLDREDGVKPRPSASADTAESYLSQTRFDQCSISPLSLKGIKEAGYERMTLVQEATLPIILKGKDVMAKARTGTGKTVAFLLPAIEAIAKLHHPDRFEKRPPINVLVICPTRELACQAAAEADKLLKYHPSIGVQAVIGGTRLTLEQKRMQANPCQILVATPGRLRDHIDTTTAFASRLKGVQILVLDEADHLLDMGFRKDLDRIIAAVPKQRQTLLFSATIPEEVRQICHVALQKDHEFVNTVEEGSEETHSQVRQMHLVTPLDDHFSVLYSILTEHIAEDVDYKVLVFCTTAMVTRMIANLLSELNMNVREIHSRKPQSYRTRVSDEFRKSKGLILVTSDVSARGVDYPDVTLVIQVGLPSDREQYIHRLGRTGRKGKQGKGFLLLAPWEEFFLASVKDLPIAKASSPPIGSNTRKRVEVALSQVEMKNKEAAYQAWLGYYNSNKKVGRDKARLVQLANEFSRSMGLDQPPAIPRLILGKMGLKNVPGLRAK